MKFFLMAILQSIINGGIGKITAHNMNSKASVPRSLAVDDDYSCAS